MNASAQATQARPASAPARKVQTYPCRGFAFFPVESAGVVRCEQRTVTVTAVEPLLNAASVTDMQGRNHVLPIERVASERTLAAKRAFYHASLQPLFRPTVAPSAPLTAEAAATVGAEISTR